MSPPHPFWVRLTHWLNAASGAALLVSGILILRAHPRLYWGESGFEGGPSLLDLPLVKHTPSSITGRNLHFLSAWICIATGAVYLTRGVMTGHFIRRLWPGRKDRPARTWLTQLLPGAPAPATGYNPLQKLSYLAVIFILFPLLILTGLAMAPGVVAAWPFLSLFGGHQSARTLHFALTVLLVAFVLVHVVKVYLAGFVQGMKAMTLGESDPKEVPHATAD